MDNLLLGDGVTLIMIIEIRYDIDFEAIIGYEMQKKAFER